MLSGVPQGIFLAPLLFICCYANDIPSTVKSKVWLYTDEYRTIHTDEDRLALQKDLNALMQCSNHWLMSCNPSKCVHLKISNRHYCSATKCYIGQHLIEQSSHITYLGVTIDEHLKWTNHVDRVVVKANATIGFFKRNLSKFLYFNSQNELLPYHGPANFGLCM